MASRFLNSLKINDAYTLPSSDGSNGQVIVTDGSGNLAFANPATSSSASIIYRDNFTGDGSTTVFYLQNSLSDEDQTQIYIDGVYQEKGTYSLSNNAITFTTAPPNGDSVEVISISGINVGPTTIYQDNFTGDGTTTDFTLAQAVNDEVKTMVYFNGVYQFKGTYSLNGTLMSFDTAPANGVAIEVISIASAAAADYNQKMLFYGKATEAISKGDAVMFAGAQGDHFLFSKATQAGIEANHELFIGLASQDLANNEYGYVTEFGNIKELDTSAYEAGDILWFDSAGSTAGALTDIEPAPPLAKIQVAAVIRSHQNEGVLFVRPTWYHELGELHDVNVTSVADKDLLVWNSTDGYWENSKTVDTLSGNTFTATTLSGTLSTAAQPNVTSVGTLSSLNVSGNLIVDTNTLYVDASSNEVGIGTTSPSATLDVHAPSTTAPSLTMGATAGQIFKNEDLEFAFGLNNASPYNAWIQTRFAGNNSRSLAINPLGGSLAIGSNSPVRKLHIEGESISTDTPTVRIASTDASGTNKFGIEFYSNNGADVRGKLLADNNGRVYIDDNGGGGVVLQANGGSGNVGIGVTLPEDKLHVANGGFRVSTTVNSNHISVKNIQTSTSSTAYEKKIRFLGYNNVEEASIVGLGNQYWGSAYNGLSFRTGTSEKMRIDSSGRVGIGTSGLTNTLHVHATEPIIRINSTSSTANKGLYFTYNNTLYSRITHNANNGQLLITSGESGMVGYFMDFNVNGSTATRIHSNRDITFCKTTTDVDTNGVWIQNSSDGAVYSSLGSPYNTYHVYNTLNDRYDFYVSYNGTIYARDVTIQSLSDERLKENIQDLTGSLDTITSLRPRVFDFKDGSKINSKGFVAQEVEQVLPECVKEFTAGETLEDGTRYKTVGQDFMPYIVGAIKELKEIIDNQQQEINDLKQRILTLENNNNG